MNKDGTATMSFLIWNDILFLGEMSMKILFVGNSHTYVNDMPQIFKMNSDIDVDVFMLARGGITFATHLQDPSLHFCLKQDYDMVVYQQAAHVPCPSKEETLRDGKELIELARKYNKKVYVLKPWSVKNDHCGYEVICDIYDTLQKENNVQIIDAGETVRRVDEVYNCYLKDNEHMNQLGSYVEACTILNTIFNQTSFKGLTLSMYQQNPFEPIKLSKEEVDLVQKVINEL